MLSFEGGKPAKDVVVVFLLVRVLITSEKGQSTYCTCIPARPHANRRAIIADFGVMFGRVTSVLSVAGPTDL